MATRRTATRRRATVRRRNPHARAENIAESMMLHLFGAQERLEKAMAQYYNLQEEVEGEGLRMTKKMRTLWTRINALTKATKLAKNLAMDVQDEVYRLAGGE